MSDMLNLWHSDLWSISFSNIPTVTDPKDMFLFESMVKNVNLPEYAMETDQSIFMGHAIIHPLAQEQNVNRQLLQIEFKLSQYLKNYLYLYKWIQNLRYGSNIEGLARKYVCSELTVKLLDNSKRTTGWFKYSNAVCKALSALPLNLGTGEEIVFVANFDFEQVLYEDADPLPEVA
jgi:hypothetical protein